MKKTFSGKDQSTLDNATNREMTVQLTSKSGALRKTLDTIDYTMKKCRNLDSSVYIR